MLRISLVAVAVVASLPSIARANDLSAPLFGKAPSRIESALWREAGPGTAKPLTRSFVPRTPEGELIVVLVPEHGKPSTSIDSSEIVAVGGRVLAQSASLVRVAVSPPDLEGLSRLDGVQFVRTPIRPQTQAVISQGVELIGAEANQARGANGTGVKVAIIDNGFSGASLSPEMPSNWRHLDYTGGGTYGGSPHGTACAEIVHDVAPEAEITLLRVSDLVDLENAKDLCIREGIDIVSHSLHWLGTGFGDGNGIACEIADDAKSKGLLWVTAAGNYARRQFSGLFADSDSDGWHQFDGEFEVLHFVEEMATGDSIEVWLTWNDWPITTEDYDLALVRSLGDGSVEVVESSETRNFLISPVESIRYHVTIPGTYGIGVWKTESARSTVIVAGASRQAVST
jgi:hypothetical protein